MQYTSIEIMALIFLVIASIKILVILINPRTWHDNVVKNIYRNPKILMVLSLILSAITLYYLLKELTIVQIFAAMLFFSLIAAVGVSVFSKDLMKLTNKLYNDKFILKKSWLYLLIWIVLILWGFKEILL